MSLRTLAVIGAVLVAVLLVTLGWEANRGRALRKQPLPAVTDTKPLDITLLPEFRISALQTRKETVERPLFVPTRRPAPPPDAVEKAPSKVERGLFVLSGTAIQGQTRIAFLRNAKDNKPKTVRVGDVVEGMNVSTITADRVVLTAGGQEEELLLKVATGPKGAVTPAAQPVKPGQPAAAVLQNSPVTQQAPQRQTNTPSDRAARRAERAARQTVTQPIKAESQAQSAPPLPNSSPKAAPVQDNSGGDWGAWERNVQRRYNPPPP